MNTTAKPSPPTLDLDTLAGLGYSASVFSRIANRFPRGIEITPENLLSLEDECGVAAVSLAMRTLPGSTFEAVASALRRADVRGATEAECGDLYLLADALGAHFTRQPPHAEAGGVSSPLCAPGSATDRKATE